MIRPLVRLALVASLGLVACGDNGDSATPDAAPTIDAASDAPAGPLDVRVQFVPKVGSAAFACGQSYPTMGDEATTITPRDFRVYVHEVQLIREDGEHVPLTLVQDGAWQYQNVALLDFENFTGGCADGTPETNAVIQGSAPAGRYTGIAFTVGVPAAMNHVDLTSLPAPLNLTGLWWGWGFGHIFLAVVTHTEITTPQPATNDHYVHLGSLDCVGDPEKGEAVACARPNRPYIELTGFDPTRTPIVADFGAVIAKSKLATSQGCHSFTEATCAYPFDFVGLNWFTGSQTPTTQKVFRIDP